MALEMIVKSLCRLGHYFPVGTILSTLHVNISSFNSPGTEKFITQGFIAELGYE